MAWEVQVQGGARALEAWGLADELVTADPPTQYVW